MDRATAEHLDRHLQRGTNVWRFPVIMNNRLDPGIDRVGHETEPLPRFHAGGQRAQMDFVAAARQLRQQREVRRPGGRSCPSWQRSIGWWCGMLLSSGGRPYLANSSFGRTESHPYFATTGVEPLLPSVRCPTERIPAIAENRQCDASGADAQQADRAGDADDEGDHHVRLAVTRSVEAIPATSPTALPTRIALVSHHARGSVITLTTLLRRLRARPARVRRALRVPGRRQRLPPRSACRSAGAAHPRRSRRPRPGDCWPATGSQRR